MSVRSWLAGSAATVTVFGGIAVVQSGITGSPWPVGRSSSSVAPVDAGLPAPREQGAAPSPAGTVRAGPVVTRQPDLAPPATTADRDATAVVRTGRARADEDGAEPEPVKDRPAKAEGKGRRSDKDD